MWCGCRALQPGLITLAILHEGVARCGLRPEPPCLLVYEAERCWAPVMVKHEHGAFRMQPVLCPPPAA